MFWREFSELYEILRLIGIGNGKGVKAVSAQGEGHGTPTRKHNSSYSLVTLPLSVAVFFPCRRLIMAQVRLSLASELFLTAKEAERVSPRTLANYRWFLSRFLSWLAEQNVEDAESITANLIRLYLVDLGKHGKPVTVRTHLKIIKTWLRFLYNEGMIERDPTARVAMPRIDDDVKRSYTPQDVDAMLKASPSLRDRAMILTLIDTGLRAQEFCAVTVGSLDISNGVIVVRRGKGRKSRVVMLGSKTRRAVLRYIATLPDVTPDTPLFPNTRTGKAMTTSGLLSWSRRLGKRAGVPGCSPHAFRRTFATWAAESDMNLDAIRRLMGHTTFAVLTKYVNQAPGKLKEAHKAHGPVDTQL